MSFSMYTQCPACRTVFKITSTQLGWAKGKVRCGSCLEIYQAMDTLAEDPRAFGAGAEAPAPPIATTAETVAGSIDQEQTSAAAPEPEAPAPPATEPAPGRPSAVVRPTVAVAPRPTQTAAWSFGIVTLLALFLGQAAYFQRDALAQYKPLRPTLERLCEFANCKLPLLRDIAAVELRTRDVRTHPTVQGALLINAVLVNEAEFAQPFPDMEVKLSNLAGSPVASRRFSPPEYIDASVDLGRGMAPGTPIVIALELADPGQEAVNFEFEFFHN